MIDPGRAIAQITTPPTSAATVLPLQPGSSPATKSEPRTPPPIGLSSVPKTGNEHCVSTGEALEHPEKDLCVAAHVYAVVELTDGTRFLDVCPPGAADAECRFTILSPESDRSEVGDLKRYQDQDIRIRGVVRPLRGRMGLVLSHARQFNLGPEKFRPNARLLRGFAESSDRLPVRDPNLKASGRHRTFMNTQDIEPTPKPAKP